MKTLLIAAAAALLSSCGGSDWPADAALDPNPQLVQQPYCPPDPSTFVGPLPAACTSTTEGAAT